MYVLTIKKEEKDKEVYIHGAYSTKSRAVEVAHNLPPCFVHISECELDNE